MRITDTLKKVATGALAAVLACGIAAGISGCGSSGPTDEELIRGQVDELFSLLQNPTKENIGQYVSSSDLEGLEDLGVDLYEFMGHSFGHLDYTIDNIEVDGDNAVVTVTITSADVQKALDDAQNWVLDDANRSEVTDAYSAGGDQGLYKLLFQKYYEFVDAQAADDLVTSTETLNVTKDSDGNWTATTSDFTGIISAVYGGFTG